MNHLKEGQKLWEDAIASDTKDNEKEAVEKYTAALVEFNTARQNIKNEAVLASLVTLIDTAKNRISELTDKTRGKPVVQVMCDVDAENANKKRVAKLPRDGAPDEEELDRQLSTVIVKDVPNVRWEDVAGLSEVKDALKQVIVLPRNFPQWFTGMRMPWKAVLLYGPPGTGKSFIAKAVATESKGKFFALSSSTLVSKYVGESERLVSRLFQMARRERPCTVFIDEIDSLCTTRTENDSESTRRIKNEILVQLDGVDSNNQGVLFLFATNMPWALDTAFRRRLDKIIYVPLPDADARESVVKSNLRGIRHDVSDVDIRRVSDHLVNFSGSDIANIVKEAVYHPLLLLQKHRWFKIRQSDGKYEPCQEDTEGAVAIDLTCMSQDVIDEPVVTLKHFKQVIKNKKPTFDVNVDMKKFDEFRNGHVKQ